jgi:hypothetical protein
MMRLVAIIDKLTRIMTIGPPTVSKSKIRSVKEVTGVRSVLSVATALLVLSIVEVASASFEVNVESVMGVSPVNLNTNDNDYYL